MDALLSTKPTPNLRRYAVLALFIISVCSLGINIKFYFLFQEIEEITATEYSANNVFSKDVIDEYAALKTQCESR